MKKKQKCDLKKAKNKGLTSMEPKQEWPKEVTAMADHPKFAENGSTDLTKTRFCANYFCLETFPLGPLLCK